jgi:4-aminobutyrate aminotransferase-like enzyme
VPPITVTDDEIDEAVAMIAASLESAIEANGEPA